MATSYNTYNYVSPDINSLQVKTYDPVANTQYFPPQYFSGCDVHVFIDDSWIAEISSLEFAVQMNVMPIYGYSSYVPTKLHKGTMLVTGQFVVNKRNKYSVHDLFMKNPAKTDTTKTQASGASTFDTSALDAVGGAAKAKMAGVITTPTVAVGGQCSDSFVTIGKNLQKVKQSTEDMFNVKKHANWLTHRNSAVTELSSIETSLTAMKSNAIYKSSVSMDELNVKVALLKSQVSSHPGDGAVTLKDACATSIVNIKESIKSCVEYNADVVRECDTPISAMAMVNSITGSSSSAKKDYDTLVEARKIIQSQMVKVTDGTGKETTMAATWSDYFTNSAGSAYLVGLDKMCSFYEKFSELTSIASQTNQQALSRLQSASVALNDTTVNTAIAGVISSNPYIQAGTGTNVVSGATIIKAANIVGAEYGYEEDATDAIKDWYKRLMGKESGGAGFRNNNVHNRMSSLVTSKRDIESKMIIVYGRVYDTQDIERQAEVLYGGLTVIEEMVLTGVREVIDSSGQPIATAYSFLAKNISYDTIDQYNTSKGRK